MQVPGAATVMPKKTPKPGRGRPKASEPLKALASYKGTDALEAWFDGLVLHADLGTRTLAIRHGLRLLAEKVGYDKKMPER